MKQNLIQGFVGKKGSGKSFRLKEIMSHLPRLIVFDPRNEHSDLIPNELNDEDDLDSFLEWASDQDTCAACYVPSGNLKDEVEMFCTLVFECTEMCVVFEEVPAYSSAGAWPDAFARLCLQGRHNRLDIMYTSQRFAECPRSLTAQTDKFFLFATREPRDIAAMEDRIGIEAAQQVSELPLHEPLIFDVEQGVVVYE